jgi:cytochrome c-type biogenesis protein CcmH
MRVLLVLVLLIAAIVPATAAVEILDFDNPTDEARYKRLIAELRCTVCQNQNLADSNAELARDLRNKVYTMIRDGKTDEEIYAFMVQRYGNYILYRPPLKTSTALLWVGPFLIMGVGVAVLLNVVRRRRRMAAEAVEEDRLARARELLEQEEKSA